MTVEEGYLEAYLPLPKNQPFAKTCWNRHRGARIALRQQGALRDQRGQRPAAGVQAQPDDMESSLIWEPVNGVRFAAAGPRDARAANFRELYYGQILRRAALRHCTPADRRSQRIPAQWNLEGNANLKPELSDTTTLGIVLTPTDWVQGLDSRLTGSTSRSTMPSSRPIRLSRRLSAVRVRPRSAI